VDPVSGPQRVIIPTLIVRDMAEALDFYTRVLDFEVTATEGGDKPFYALLARGPDELHLALTSGRVPPGHGCAMVVCADVDGLFASFRARGLAVPTRQDSPVHEGPVDQTWGAREFYVDDPSGNTLAFQQR
jgi:catechol 2,3-dioxygenase-like lactoylglutathione lyase family enzyme